MEDLSALTRNSITATSQAAGNMTAGNNRQAMTAPGSQPVDPLPPTNNEYNPNLEMSPEVPVSWTGKPPPRPDNWNPPPPRWAPARPQGVTRTPPPEPPEPSGHGEA